MTCVNVFWYLPKYAVILGPDCTSFYSFYGTELKFSGFSKFLIFTYVIKMCKLNHLCFFGLFWQTSQNIKMLLNQEL